MYLSDSDNKGKRWLGDLQRRLLLWIGVHAGVRPHVLVGSGPPRERFPYGGLDPDNELAEEFNEEECDVGPTFNFFGKEMPLNTYIELRLLRGKNPEYLANYLRGLSDVSWQPEAFLGTEPSRSESATLSEALRKLEERTLIRRLQKGTATFTTHVRLQPEGLRYCISFWRSWFDHAFTSAEEPPEGIKFVNISNWYDRKKTSDWLRLQYQQRDFLRAHLQTDLDEASDEGERQKLREMLRQLDEEFL